VIVKIKFRNPCLLTQSGILFLCLKNSPQVFLRVTPFLKKSYTPPTASIDEAKPVFWSKKTCEHTARRLG
ncbi:hypothetical protein, partial [Pseudomonas lundensis]|uniref:hypothetical protein n=1 Tax=Pseudomonas lundensis TaxID=86185 RepID=UPI001C542AB1